MVGKKVRPTLHFHFGQFSFSLIGLCHMKCGPYEMTSQMRPKEWEELLQARPILRSHMKCLPVATLWGLERRVGGFLKVRKWSC